MGLPMPLHERFATGTQWELCCPYHHYEAGTRVRVEGPPVESETVICCPCSMSGGEILLIPIDILG